MKRVCTFLLLAAFCMGIYAQELDSLKSIMNKETGRTVNQDEEEVSDDDHVIAPVTVEDDGDEVKVKVMDREVVKVVENGDSTYVKLGNKGVLQVIDQPDSTSIRVGDKEIKIVEHNDDTDIHIGKVDDYDDDRHISNPRFRGHWAGFEWGINNFVDNDFSISRPSMDLNSGRSWVINLNFAQYSMGFGTSHIGLLTGLGLEMNNYFFDNNSTIVEINDQIIDSALAGNVAKSKLTSTFLRVPLILEVQFPNTIRAKRIFLSAGIVAGLKLGSHTKIVYKDNGKNKDKNRDDFNMNPFRLGLTARAGFGNISIFGDYYFTPMFVENKGPAGPELHPFSVGLAFNF